jgi:hypothetical protein
MEDRDAILGLIGRINDAWRNRRTGDLRDLFHESIVFAAPGLVARVEGREACIKSYDDFLGVADVEEYRETPPKVESWGDTAVATFGWEMAWTMHGRSHRESGHDLFVFTRQDGRWWAVWRTILPATGRDEPQSS